MANGSHSSDWSRSSRRVLYGVLGTLGTALIAAVVIGVLALTSHASLSAAPSALARVDLPFGGGRVESVVVVGGREQKLVAVALRSDQIWPTKLVRAGESVTVHVTVKRAGWIGWLTGSTEHVTLTLTTPTSALRSDYLTVRHGSPLELAFRTPVRVVEYVTQAGKATREVLSQPQSEVSLTAPAPAGTLLVRAAPRPWERLAATTVSWFPAGVGASAVADPAPGTTIGPDTDITLTFSKPLNEALGASRPPVSPDTPGTWHTLNSHTIKFIPTGFGYGLGADVSVNLPAGVKLVGGENSGSDPVGKWSVPAGSTVRLQQMLAILGYLPVTFHYTGKPVKPTLSAEVNAAIHPPKGTFTWRYPNTPSALTNMWEPGASGELTKGAVMAFENNEGMTADGLPGPDVWKALINADLKDQKYTFGYTFVQVSEGSPETESTWHNGKVVVSGLVNTGIPAAPTATGTFAVFEHVSVTTMSGYNPDGSYYSDPGIPWVSYFNGGDALHGFIRGSYGFPQSLGCVEMPFSEAGEVYPYTPIGTIVNVT